MISNFEKRVKEKRNALRCTVKQRYYNGKKSPKAFLSLMDTIVFDTEIFQRDCTQAYTLSLLFSVNMTSRDRLRNIYRLLQQEDTYFVLSNLGICPGLFIALMSDFIDSRYRLDLNLTDEITLQWDFIPGTTDCFDYYDSMRASLLERLKVLYD